MKKADIGVIGLGVMGSALGLNMERNGFLVAGLTRDETKVRAFDEKGKNTLGFSDENSFLDALEKPRRIMMMVPAGAPVDAVIDSLSNKLDPNDLLIDGGNTCFTDTEHRADKLKTFGVNYLGAGVSGGQYGALWGPSIMPGGEADAWELVKPLFEAIAAKVDGEPCVAYLGPGGAGHYVKMVHNGIEYGDMQLIAEAYDILSRGLGLTPKELHQVFAEWNEGELESYLIEISRDIFAKIDEVTGEPLVDLILDEAKQKGTGKWTSQNALDLGVATPTINAAVEARILSSLKDERMKAAKTFSRMVNPVAGDRETVIEDLRAALYASKIDSYAQGFALLRAASEAYGYGLDLGTIAKIWRGGCIIRARILDDIRLAFGREPSLVNLMMADEFGKAIESRQDALRRVVRFAVENGIPVPAFGSALAYFDAYRSERMPANLTQAQRDYFGAHTYRRIDREGSFHTEWVNLGKPPEGSK
jgi:6-phosphogluconate dehydrogenase